MRSIRLRLVSLIFISGLLACGACGLFFSLRPITAAAPVPVPAGESQAAARLELVRSLLILHDKTNEGLLGKRLDELKKSLKTNVDIAHGLVDYFYQAVQRRVFNEAQAKRQATEALRLIRFDGDRYFWADTTGYQVLVLPFKPSEEGRNWENVTDAEGKKFAKELADRAAAEGEVYLNYRLRRDGEAVPKQGYARLFKPWNWVIGSSKFTDAIEKEVADIERAGLLELRGLVYTSGGGTDGLFAIDAEKRYVLHVDAGLLGKPADTAALESGQAVALKYEKRGWTLVLPGRAAPTPRLDAPAPTADISYARGVEICLLAIAGALALALLAFAASAGLDKPIQRLEQNLPDLSAKAASGQAGFAAAARTAAIARQATDELANDLEIAAQDLSNALELLERRPAVPEAGPPAAALGQARTILLELKHSAAQEAGAAKGLSADAASLNILFERLMEKTTAGNTALISTRQTAGNALEESVDNREITRSIKTGMDDMQEMIVLINEISERINVLAINAAIEAAHAGEAGKGFMVIAEEIRRLADGTRQSSDTISQSLDSLAGHLNAAARDDVAGSGHLERLSVQLAESAAAWQEQLELVETLAERGGLLAQAISGRASLAGRPVEVAASAVEAMERAAADLVRPQPPAARGERSAESELTRLSGILKNIAEKLRRQS